MTKIFFTSLFNRSNKKTIPNLVSGFTLVETMVAVLILTLTIVSLMTVVANSLFAARYAGNEITASYLLQEAVDYIRNDRDTSVFLQSGDTGGLGGPWEIFIAKYSNCTAAKNLTGGCYLDIANASVGVLPEFTSTDNRKFYYHPEAEAGSYYNYDSAPNPNNLNPTDQNKKVVVTNFSRQILVEKNVLYPDELNVTVTVSWRNGGLDKSRSLSTTLMRWQ
jgi:type II secretory pathway pseudopilin PulG